MKCHLDDVIQRNALFLVVIFFLNSSIHVEVGVLWVVSTSRLSSIVLVVRIVNVKLAAKWLFPRQTVVIGGIHAVKTAPSWVTPRYVGVMEKYTSFHNVAMKR